MKKSHAEWGKIDWYKHAIGGMYTDWTEERDRKDALIRDMQSVIDRYKEENLKLMEANGEVGLLYQRFVNIWNEFEHPISPEWDMPDPMRTIHEWASEWKDQADKAKAEVERLLTDLDGEHKHSMKLQAEVEQLKNYLRFMIVMVNGGKTALIALYNVPRKPRPTRPSWWG